jgi:hypothetical protein
MWEKHRVDRGEDPATLDSEDIALRVTFRQGNSRNFNNLLSCGEVRRCELVRLVHGRSLWGTFVGTVKGGVEQAQNHDDKCCDDGHGCDLIWVSAANEHGELDAGTGLWYEDDAHIISPPIGKLMSEGPVAQMDRAAVS